jgi:ribosomal protein S18 acetylase RimI-like enzyme
MGDALYVVGPLVRRRIGHGVAVPKQRVSRGVRGELMMIIRRAAASDAAALSALAEATFRATFGPHNAVTDVEAHCARAFSEDMQSQEIADVDGLTLLAQADGTPIGFAQLRWRSAPACVPGRRPGEIHRLYLRADHHGQGVAQDLMNASIKEMAARGSDMIWLGVWEENRRAIAFYKKFGFTAVGDHVFMFGTDPQRDIVMVRAGEVDRT